MTPPNRPPRFVSPRRKTPTLAGCATLALLALVGTARADLSGTEAALDLDAPLVRSGVGAGTETLGYTFSLDAARALTHLGLFSYNGSTSPTVDRQIGVWDNAGTLVAEVTIPVGGGVLDDRGDGDLFIYQALDTPVVLSAGETYTAGVWYSVDNSPGLAFDVAFTPIDGFNYHDAMFSDTLDGAFVKPTNPSIRTNAFIGPNLRFDLTLPKPDFGSSLRITEVAIDGDTITLTWVSNPTKTYIVNWSLDLVTFPGDFADGIPADPGETTTRSFSLSGAGVESEERLFVRVQEEPPAP